MPFNTIRRAVSRSFPPLTWQQRKRLGRCGDLFTARRTAGSRFGKRADRAEAELAAFSAAGSGDSSEKKAVGDRLQATAENAWTCPLGFATEREC